MSRASRHCICPIPAEGAEWRRALLVPNQAGLDQSLNAVSSEFEAVSTSNIWEVQASSLGWLRTDQQFIPALHRTSWMAIDVLLGSILALFPALGYTGQVGERRAGPSVSHPSILAMWVRLQGMASVWPGSRAQEEDQEWLR